MSHLQVAAGEAATGSQKIMTGAKILQSVEDITNPFSIYSWNPTLAHTFAAAYPTWLLAKVGGGGRYLGRMVQAAGVS